MESRVRFMVVIIALAGMVIGMGIAQLIARSVSGAIARMLGLIRRSLTTIWPWRT